jgi:hypothetical protein
MRQDTLFQFVGFETTVNLDDFTSQWENFARKFFKLDVHAVTLQQQVKSRNRFKYMSMNEWPQDNFRFSFMEGRGSDYFPDHRVKVVQVGGYTPVHLECEDHHAHEEMKIMLLLNQEDVDENSFSNMPYHFLNIYQAYYQSCLYAYIVELFAEDGHEAELLEMLKTRFAHCDVGTYRECLVIEG